MASAAFTPPLGPLSLLFNRQLENETDGHSPPLGVVMNEWSYTSTPPHSFMACTGIYIYIFTPLPPYIYIYIYIYIYFKPLSVRNVHGNTFLVSHG